MIREMLTARLRLRPLGSGDAAAVRGLWTERDPRVPARRRLDDRGHPTVAEIAQSLGDQHSDTEDSGPGLMALETRSRGEFVGYCGTVIGAASREEPEIAFEIAAQFHGLGYATEAAHAVVRAAREAGRARLWASVREWNAPSFRVLEKIGFVDSGVRTPDAIHGDSVWWSMDLGHLRQVCRR